jgi:hypothetical protein
MLRYWLWSDDMYDMAVIYNKLTGEVLNTVSLCFLSNKEISPPNNDYSVFYMQGYMTPEMFKKSYMYKSGLFQKKDCYSISVNKNLILADGVDESAVLIMSRSNRPSVTVDIGGVLTDVDMEIDEDGAYRGVLQVSTFVPGMHTISIPDETIYSNVISILAEEVS